MKILFTGFKYLGLLLVIICLAQSETVRAQPEKGFGAAKLIMTDEQVRLTFHKASSTGVINKTPLTTEQVDAGFKSGEAVGIRLIAPFDCYVYVVNVSQWDGTTLQYPPTPAQNVVIPANTEKDFAFILENQKQNPTTGREELLVMITKTKIENPELKTVLDNPEKKIAISETQAKEAQTLLKSSLAPASPTTPVTTDPANPPKSSKVRTVISVGCKIAGLFFPFAKIACAIGGFGAARYISAPGNTTGVVAEQETKALTLRVSFAVNP